MGRIHNFSAGPAGLPTEVLETAQQEFLDFQGSGMSVIEMSHRGKVFDKVHTESMELIRKIANIPDHFDICYMTGGASTQFALVPMNLLRAGKKAGYVNTGSWSKKAIAQAKLAKVDYEIVATSEETNFDRIPEFSTPQGLDYLHITSNNTIFGTQFQSLPDPADSKLVIDMSSDFLSKPIDWSGIGLAYAGLQKNAGPSGLTVAVIDKSLYEREKETTPTMFRYSTFGENQSLYNTPPTFQIYMLGLILKWIESKGGLTGIAKHNEDKAALVYEAIDTSSGFYEGHSEKSSRSLMNVTFTMQTDELTQKFLEESKKAGMDGLKGHRSVGGLRASIYNAMTQEGCRALAGFMKDFAQKNG